MRCPTNWDQVYPRPSMVRNSFHSLNGPWTCNQKPIQVPFAPQDLLSGYADKWQDVEAELFYEKDVILPDHFYDPDTQDLILHFGAVDQQCTVFINGQECCRHTDGYLPFECDISSYLHKDSPTRFHLSVHVFDILDENYPCGKQSAKPQGMWYTPVSGIWQSVWLEAVPKKERIRSLKITPCADLKGFDLEVETDAEKWELLLELKNRCVWISSDRKFLHVDISKYEKVHLWSVDAPFLYHFSIRTATDLISSRVGIRQIAVESFGGSALICQNHHPLFLCGLLDQGYYSPGLYLPESPKRMEGDLKLIKAMGFNCVRKHEKVEPEWWYALCDELGLLVIQDFVRSGPYYFIRDTVLPTLGFKKQTLRPASGQRQDAWDAHGKGVVALLYNHPSVIGYTLFNEGWGQFASAAPYAYFRTLDPTRLYDTASGWPEAVESDLQSEHLYFRNRILYQKERRPPLFLSECGGYNWSVEGHSPKSSYGYGKSRSQKQFMAKITTLYRKTLQPSIELGLCGFILTQFSDVETETNGMITFDRQVIKADVGTMRKLNASMIHYFHKHLMISQIPDLGKKKEEAM